MPTHLNRVIPSEALFSGAEGPAFAFAFAFAFLFPTPYSLPLSTRLPVFQKTKSPAKPRAVYIRASRRRGQRALYQGACFWRLDVKNGTVAGSFSLLDTSLRLSLPGPSAGSA